jgi:hypothetical protein
MDMAGTLSLWTRKLTNCDIFMQWNMNNRGRWDTEMPQNMYEPQWQCVGQVGKQDTNVFTKHDSTYVLETTGKQVKLICGDKIRTELTSVVKMGRRQFSGVWTPV